MGCLNSSKNFNHWFGNIHLSGPCNRSCYFCIGQYMMDLDSFDNLSKWPLKNIDGFVSECKRKKINEINLTGTNTDPLLYQHQKKLTSYLRSKIQNLSIGIRTNGIANLKSLEFYDRISLSIHSFDDILYRQIMGSGTPPNLSEIMNVVNRDNIKINIVLLPENVKTGDIFHSLDYLNRLGIKRINLREPYGQPHVGNPIRFPASGYQYGMPYYFWGQTRVLYWDVHYVEVESINLYANGRISETYPITLGHSDNGKVQDQSKFKSYGRNQEQWLKPLENK